MELLNTITKARADRLYKPIDDILRRDLNDNATEILVVGDSVEDRKVVVEYSLDMPIANRSQSGELVITQNSSGVDLSHTYSYAEPEIDAVEFVAEVVSGSIRIQITCTGVGENPVFLYRLSSIPLP